MDRRILVAGLALVLILSAYGIGFSGSEDQASISKSSEDQEWRSQVENISPEKATFAGGCFWCIEGAFEGVKGVEAAVSGYAGGSRENATYEKVSTGKTDHREAVRIRYYPSVISYKELLDMYWRSIDPTDPGGQFADRGYQYTTAIYYHNKKQKKLAEQSKKNLSQSGKFNETIVTEIENLTTFFKAEKRHQNYSRRNTAHYKLYERASGRKGFLERTWERSPLS